MSDLISRADAIDAVWKLDKEATEYVMDDTNEIHGYCTAIGVCVGELSALPSAELNEMNVNIEYDVEYLPNKDGVYQAKAIISKAEPSDLISREDAIEAVADVFAPTPTEAHIRSNCIDALSALPSADAESVVRCKDCDRGFGSPVCPIQSQGWAINTDTFYCEWGERREP